MNNVSLMGRLTADPELKYTQSNTAFTRFSIAVDRAYTKAGEERQADFISITAWNKTAEFVCKYFQKGKRIALNGSIRTGSYIDKDGNKRYTFEVWANNVEFCDSNKDSNTTPKQATEYSRSGSNEDFQQMPADEDLPF